MANSLTSNFMDSLNQHLPNGLLLLLQPVNQGSPEMINQSCLGICSQCTWQRKKTVSVFHVSVHLSRPNPECLLLTYLTCQVLFCWFYAEGCWRKHRKPCRAEPLKIIPTPQRPNASSSGDPVSAEPVTDEIPRRHYRANFVERLRSSGEWRPPPHRTWRIETKIKTQNPITPSQISSLGWFKGKIIGNQGSLPLIVQ